jgi:hypothetical protein
MLMFYVEAAFAKFKLERAILLRWRDLKQSAAEIV